MVIFDPRARAPAAHLSIWRTIACAWRQRALARRSRQDLEALLQLDDRQLHDVGLLCGQPNRLSRSDSCSATRPGAALRCVASARHRYSYECHPILHRHRLHRNCQRLQHRDGAAPQRLSKRLCRAIASPRWLLGLHALHENHRPVARDAWRHRVAGAGERRCQRGGASSAVAAAERRAHGACTRAAASAAGSPSGPASCHHAHRDCFPGAERGLGIAARRTAGPRRRLVRHRSSGPGHGRAAGGAHGWGLRAPVEFKARFSKLGPARLALRKAAAEFGTLLRPPATVHPRDGTRLGARNATDA